MNKNRIIKSEENFNNFVNNNNQECVDDFLKNLFYGNGYKLNCNYFRDKWINNHIYIFDYVNKRYNDSSSLYESLYRIKNHLDVRPVCKICGGIVNFSKGVGFMEHCSAKCSANDQTTKQKHIDTCLQRYGQTSYSKTDECKEKSKNTCLDRYGYISPCCSPDIKKKSRETCMERYGVEFITQFEGFKKISRKSCVERYGVEYPTQCEEMKNKSRETCIKHYGVPYYLQSDDCLEKSKEFRKSKHGYYGSKKENELLKYLKMYFKEIKREYKSDVYPFHCDFYIPSIDLYIEYNGMWTHNNHPYDENSEYDKDILNKWIERSKTSNYYKRAIQIWTVEDVNKRITAKMNKLNWIEGFNIKEILDKLKKYI